MKEALASFVPPCPGCRALLVGDGSERRCAACGRAFTLTTFAGTGKLVYRDAPLVELVPSHDRMPIVGIDVVNARLPLDVLIGNAWATFRTARLRPVLARSTLVLTASLSVGALIGWPLWAWLLLTFFVAMDL